MAALPASNTARLFVDYNDSFFTHTLQFRFVNTGTGLSDVLDAAVGYLQFMEPKLNVITIGTVEVAEAGSNVRNPVAWTGDASYGSGAMTGQRAPFYIDFTGKDAAGHRWHLTQFSVSFGQPATWKYNFGDDSDLDAAQQALVGNFDDGDLVTISGAAAVVNLVFPVGYNDRFIVERRG